MKERDFEQELREWMKSQERVETWRSMRTFCRARYPGWGEIEADPATHAFLEDRLARGPFNSEDTPHPESPAGQALYEHQFKVRFHGSGSVPGAPEPTQPQADPRSEQEGAFAREEGASSDENLDALERYRSLGWAVEAAYRDDDGTEAPWRLTYRWRDGSGCFCKRFICELWLQAGTTDQDMVQFWDWMARALNEAGVVPPRTQEPSEAPATCIECGEAMRLAAFDAGIIASLVCDECQRKWNR